MSVRISGLLLKRFFRDESAWPAGQRFQAAEFMVDGTHVPDPLSIADGALVEVRGGLTFLSARDQAGPSLEIRLALWLADAANRHRHRHRQSCRKCGVAGNAIGTCSQPKSAAH